MKKITVLIILALSISSLADGLKAKERIQYEEWVKYLTDIKDGASYGKLVVKNCGYDIKVSLPESFVTPFMRANTSAASYCDAPRTVLSSMCETNPIYKKAITEKIKKITCKLGKAEEKTLKLSGTELIFTVGLGASNLEEATKNFLEEAL